MVSEDDVLRPVVPIRIKTSGFSKIVYGIIDSGADRDVISEEVVKALAIETKATDMRVITVENEIVSKRTTASFIIESIDESYRANVNDGLVAKLLCNDISPSRRNLEGYHHLKHIQFDDIEAEISIIISAAHFRASIPKEVRTAKDCSLLAYRCAWGWTLTGSCGSRSANAAAISAISARHEPLDENLQKPFNCAHIVKMDGSDAKAQATRVGETLEKQSDRTEMTPETEVTLKARQENANIWYTKKYLKGMKDSQPDNADALGCERSADERLEEALLMRPLIDREGVQCVKGIEEWSRSISQLAKPRIRARRRSGCSISADEQLHCNGDAIGSRSTPENETKKASNSACSNVAQKDLVAITQSDMQKAETDNVRDTGVRDHLRDAIASKTKTQSPHFQRI